MLADPEQGESPCTEDLAGRIARLVAAGRRGEAVELYQTEHIGLPADVVAQIRQAPFRPALEAVAHTLVYETKIVGDGSVPRALAASVAAPTLVIAGGTSLPFMREMAPELADAIPDARARVLEGQTHDIDPQALAPVLEEFFAAPPRGK